MDELIPYLETVLNSKIISNTPVSGGDINDAYKINTSSQSYFIKINRSHQSKAMFLAEKDALIHLAAKNCIQIPKVIEVGEVGLQAFLLMEHIESQRAKASHFSQFGRQLANLHNQTQPQFGLDHDNFIGSLPQTNTYNESWSKFYAHERLWPQLQLALKNGSLSQNEIPEIDYLENVMDKICHDVTPALLHGDLWSGNFLIDLRAQPVLIDPAMYYGDRMVDIALSKLFGGFGDTFYDSYYANSPKISNQKSKIDLYQLYYILVHLNLFGNSYRPAVKSILNMYF